MKKMFTTKPGWVFLILAFLGLSLQTFADNEPNNTLATAENAAFGSPVSGSLNQSPVGDHDDYYLIVAPSDGDITVTADMGAGLNAYIHIYDKSGDGNVQVYAAGGSTVSVTKNCMAADTFVVYIDFYQGAGSYSFTTSMSGTSFANDTEDNGSIENVSQFISEGETVTGHIGYYDTDPGYDEFDYFGVILPADGSYTFRVIRDLGKTSQTFYLKVYRKDGTLIDNTFSYTDTTFAVGECLSADTVYLQIDRYQGCGGYILSFEMSTPPGTMNDIEDNGSISNVSQFISDGETVTGHIGYFDVDLGYDEFDYFGVILPTDGSYTFRAIRDLGKTSQTFYLTVYRKDGTSLGSVFTYTDTTYALADCLTADTVYLQVDRYQGCGGYTLSFENTTPPGTANDAEDNGSIENVSQFISYGESVTGHIGYYDVDLGYDENDYFGVILPQDGGYTFRAIRDLGKTNQTFYLNVRRKDGSLLDNPFSNSDTTYASVDCLAADTVYIQIDRYQGCGGYTLSFELTELMYNNDLGDNETLAAASLVPTSSVNEGHLGYYDMDSGTDGFDFYKFTVVQVPFELDIKVEIAETLNAYVGLYNAAGTIIQSEYHSPGSYNFTRTITVAGDYYIGLDHYSGCGSYSIGNFCANAPEVAITVDGSTAICPGESVLLTATDGLDAYSWLRDGIEVSTAQIYLATEPGTYVVAGYDINGCDGLSEEVVINVFGVPDVSISTEDETTFCEGGSITLTATAGFDSYAWSNGASGQSLEISESGNYTVTATTEDGCDKVSSNSIDVTVLVDTDSDGVCDVDDNCPMLPGEVGDACDDGNSNTESDVITADCECEGTIMFDCPALSANIGDACDDGNGGTVGDAINADCLCVGTLTYDCENLQANFGSVCDDGNSSTENDIVTEDCECLGTIVYDCPALSANIGDACDDGNAETVGDAINADCLCVGTLTYDCENLQANIGSVCDDGNSNTENDIVTEDCECLGSIVFDCPALSANVGETCDDGNAETENDTVSEDCECAGTPIAEEFDCPDLEANIGDACNDGDDSTSNDMIIEDCSCAGTPIVTPDCNNFVYYISDHAAADGISDIYGVTLSGGVATMTYIATSEIEIHVAYNSIDNLIYAVSKHTNSYRTLNPVSGVWGAEVMLGANYGELTAAVINADGKLLIGSQNNNAIYSVNLTTNLVSTYDPYSPVTGGDLAFGSDGMLYLTTRSGNGLYQNWPSDVMPDILIGSVPTKVTGLAITDTDELLVSAQGQTSLQVYNTAGSNIGSYALELDGAAYTLRDGDMASGCIDFEVPTPPSDPFQGELQSALIAYPNPTPGSSQVVFVTAETGRTLVEVYDMSGRNVATLFNSEAQQGVDYRLDFDGSSLPNGVYIYRMTTKNESIITKFMIAR